MNYRILFSASLILIFSCKQKDKVNTETYKWPENIKAPVAEKKPFELTAHGDTRIDNYYWMADYFKKGPDSTKAVEYLEAENSYLDTMMSGTKEFRETLFKEMKGRIKEEDQSVPFKDN